MFWKRLMILWVILYSLAFTAKEIHIDSLRNQISHYNDFAEYKTSMQLISDFLADGRASHHERYTAFLLKAMIYKKLFNYDQTLHNLDLALQEGMKSNRKEMVQQEIKAEKSFVYFDLQQFERAKQFMKDLEAAGYQYLSAKQRVFLYTQEGYFLMKDKEYDEAEKSLDHAIQIAKKFHLQDIPIVYGKKIELYNETNDTEKRDEMYREGLKIAQKFGNLKYEFYLHEIMKNVFRKNQDYQKAFEFQQICDSVFFLYNSSSNSSKIELLEQQMKAREYEYNMKEKRNEQFFFVILSGLLIFVILIFIKLYLVNKQKRILTEDENRRILHEIEILTNSASKKDGSKTDLASFNLTERQREIIELVKQGKNNRQIAELLFISENTVKYHLKVIYNILNINQRTEL